MSQVSDRKTIGIPGPAGDASPEMIAAAAARAAQIVDGMNLPGQVKTDVTAEVNRVAVPIAAEAGREAAVSVIADDPTVAEAVAEKVLTAEGIAFRSDPGMPQASAPDVFTQTDARRRRLAGVASDGRAFAVLGTSTPHAGLDIPQGVPVLAGTFDPVRRRWFQDAIGLDGRFLPETIGSIAARIQAGDTGTKRAPHLLTGPAGGGTDTATSRTVRVPVKFPVRVSGASLMIRNRDDRSGTVYPGSISVSGIWWGKAARDSFGEFTGAFASAPTQIAGPFTTPANGDPMSIPLTLPAPADGGEDYLLSFGYTCAAQSNHLGIGGGWLSTASGDAAAVSPALSRVQRVPLDLWLDCDIPAGTPLVGWLGDSLTLASEATLPVYDSPARQHALANRVWPVLYAHHGSNMQEWAGGDTYRWSKFRNPACTSIVWALGSNDVFNGEGLDELRARFVALHPKVVTNLGTARIYLATMMPRNGSATVAWKEANRVGYNDWLYQRPMGAWGVFDFAKSVEAAVGTVRADYITADNVHLTTAGYAQNARAVVAPLT